MAEHEWMNEVARPGRQGIRARLRLDKINAPMIRQWCEVMGVDATRYTAEGAVVRHTAMLQVWCMEGPVANNYPPGSTTENPYEALKLLEAQGMASVVAVNSRADFGRDVREGERLYYTTRLDSVGPEKTDGAGHRLLRHAGNGVFLPAAQGDEEVGQLLFRVFKFRPANPVKPAG